MKNLLLILLLTASLQSIAETNNNTRSSGCIDVITYGLNPETEEWRAFPTPCDVPQRWEKSYTRPSSCLDIIVYGQNPNTEKWESFETSCDVPATWESKACPNFVIYGQNPKTKNWYKFSTPCDVAKGWNSSNKVPETFQEKSAEKATYDSEQGVLYIPLLDHISYTKITKYKNVEFKKIDNPYYYLVLKLDKLTKITEVE